MTNFELMEYNTTREHLIIREYGRHIQKMVDYIMTIEDRENRTRNANVIIELMGFLNPHVRQEEDYKHKLWDHLYIISDFKLDVDSPYPMPEKGFYTQHPEPMPYPRKSPKHNHLGKNLELLIDKAMQEGDPEKKQGLANAIGYYMKLTYSNWHKELVHDENIQSELSALSDGDLAFDTKLFVKHRTTAKHEDFVSNIGKPRKSHNRNGRGNGRNTRKHGRKRY